MSRGPIRRVAIVGAGPAGASLATYLAREGIEVTLFSSGARPPIVVGESLVPAIVPFLRRLGVEEEVAGYSIWKPGATFVLDRDQILSFTFAEVRKAKTTYSYNVPRDRMDASILEAARREGVQVVEGNARLAREGETDRVRLGEESLQAAGLSSPPDLVVDAAGRSRLVSRLLGIPALTGPRRDTALHAHVEGVPLVVEGNVHTDRLDHGWCWRIPLPGRVSTGLVMDSAVIREFGDSIEEQFDNYLSHDSRIREWGATAKRVSPVVKYTNYQLRSTRGVGDGWALVGDAFGFVDPVFSSGLLVGMDGAWELSRTILDGSERAFQRYEAHVARHLEVWQRVVGYWYDGRLFTLFRVGELMRQRFAGRMMDFHFRKHMPRVFTGEATTKRYSLGLLDFMIKYGLGRNDPEELSVR